MSYQVFARKTRPRNFSEVVGQSHVLQALANGLDANRVHHAFLFTGTRGVGKTTIARIFSKALNCEKGVSATPCGECAHCVDIDEGRFVDLIEIDAASRTGVDDIRELIENVQYAPTRGRHKVYLIDEVHMLSNSAFNALLKTLEEPPEHVKFLLATTDPQKIPVTVLSRCLQFNLRRLNATEIKDHLANVLDTDGISYEGTALSLIARAADGSVRDALSLLDQALNFGAGKLAEAETRAMLGTVDEARVVALLASVVAADANGCFQQIEALQSFGFDWKASLAELASLCQRAAVYQKAPQALPEDTPALEAIREFAAQLSDADIQLYYQIAVAGLRDMDFAPDPRAGFEMVLLRMLAFQPAPRVANAQKKTELTATSQAAAGENTAETQTKATAAVESSTLVATELESNSAAVTDNSRAASPMSVQSVSTSSGINSNSSPNQNPSPSPSPGPSPQQHATEQAPKPAAAQQPAAAPEAVPEAELEAETKLETTVETPATGITANDSSVTDVEPSVQQSVQTSPVPAHNVANNVPTDFDWAVFAASLPLKGMLVTLAENTTVLSQNAQQLQLGVNDAMAAVCPEGVRSRFVEIVQQHLQGVEIQLTVLAADDQAVTSTPAAKAAQAQEQRQLSAQQSIEKDPNIQQLVNEFDAQIEPASVSPVTSV